VAANRKSSKEVDNRTSAPSRVGCAAKFPQNGYKDLRGKRTKVTKKGMNSQHVTAQRYSGWFPLGGWHSEGTKEWVSD